MRRALIVFACLLVAAGCTGAKHNTAQSIESQVWSPYCPGRLLIDCTTSQARDLRADIQRRVDRGDGADSVMRWIAGEFGNEAIARPSGRSGLVIWLVPALLFAIGLVVVVRFVRKATAASRTL